MVGCHWMPNLSLTLVRLHCLDKREGTCAIEMRLWVIAVVCHQRLVNQPPKFLSKPCSLDLVGFIIIFCLFRLIVFLIYILFFSFKLLFFCVFESFIF
jgi:hypothetical protein